MYFLIEVDDPADIGKDEKKRWIAHDIDIQGVTPVVLHAVVNAVHPATKEY